MGRRPVGVRRAVDWSVHEPLEIIRVRRRRDGRELVVRVNPLPIDIVGVREDDGWYRWDGRRYVACTERQTRILDNITVSCLIENDLRSGLVDVFDCSERAAATAWRDQSDWWPSPEDWITTCPSGGQTW